MVAPIGCKFRDVFLRDAVAVSGGAFRVDVAGRIWAILACFAARTALYSAWLVRELTWPVALLPSSTEPAPADTQPPCLSPCG